MAEALEWMDQGKEWDEEADVGLDDIVRSLAIPVARDWQGYNIGGAERWTGGLDDTPKSLYRALFLFKPKAVDFSDMYKPFLFGVMSPCGRFSVSFELWKYEFTLRFWVREKSDVSGSRHGVICGAPSSDNGVACSSDEGTQWFEMVRKAVSTELDVYGGNSFRV